MSKLIFDMSKSGLETVFKPWQVEVFEVLNREKRFIGSAYIHKTLQQADIIISRASVINFLAAMEKEGLLLTETHTGKGGHHELYMMKFKTFTEMREKLALSFINSISVQLRGGNRG